MPDRSELLETALDCLPEGIALFDKAGEVILWNQAAQAVTGYAAIDLLAQPLPDGLEPLLPETLRGKEQGDEEMPQNGERTLARARHKMGHSLPVITRVLVLRDTLGERIGAAVLFHPAESLDALPHGETRGDKGVEESRAEIEERLQEKFDDFARGGTPFGVMWVGVDQAEELRKTHGAGAHQTMIEKVRRALSQGLRPVEEMGRWGDEEFLILASERSAEMLAVRARTLAGMARTADFRWWGDRISLSVSIGSAQAVGHGESLAQLLERTRDAMEASRQAGGNRATAAAIPITAAEMEEEPCSPS